MEMHSFYTRQMLLNYGKQLVAARRLARYEHLLGTTSAPDPREAARQRMLMVERVAKEITENLIFTGSDNVIVQEILAVLQQELQETLIFRYPPGSLDFQVLRVAGEGESEIVGEEKHRVMEALWQVALRVVDATML